MNQGVSLGSNIFNSYIINGRSFSISVWFDPQVYESSSNWGQFFDFGPPSNSPRNDFDFYWFTSSSTGSGERVSIEWYNNLSGSCTPSTCFPGPSYSPPSTLKSTWHNAVFVYNAATFTGSLYLDGKLVSSYQDASWDYKPGTSLGYMMGLGYAAGSPFPGLLSTESFYIIPLSSQAVAALYQSSVPNFEQ
jgi:hypothetical protein